MKLLIIGDPHFQVKNVLDIELFHTKIKEQLDTQTYSYIIILGDILHDHDRLNTIPMNMAYNFIRMCKSYAKTICLVGNHDLINNREFLSTNHWMNGMKEWDNVEIIDTTKTFEDLFVCVPYVEPGRFRDALSRVSDWKRYKLIFAHQEMQGCKMGALISEEGDEWDEEDAMLISGHIHENQWVGKNVYYPGSCLQHSYGESHHKVIAEYDTDTKQINEIEIQTTRKKTIYKDISEFKKMNVDDITENTKIVVSGEHKDFMQFKKTKKYKEMKKENIKIVYKYKGSDEIAKNEQEVNFDTRLDEIVMSKKNISLEKDYKNIIGNK